MNRFVTGIWRCREIMQNTIDFCWKFKFGLYFFMYNDSDKIIFLKEFLKKIFCLFVESNLLFYFFVDSLIDNIEPVFLFINLMFEGKFSNSPTGIIQWKRILKLC